MQEKQNKFGNNQSGDLIPFLSSFNIDNQIILACTSRQVPSGNHYWQESSTYIEMKVRYLSIPFWLEICHRLKLVPLSKLLSEKYLNSMEIILHYSELEEQKVISFDECVTKCSEISMLSTEYNNLLESDLNRFITVYPEYVSLRRGNFLVFFNVLLVDNNPHKLISISKLLTDLIICGCIIDDLHDYTEDKLLNELNIVIELEEQGKSLNDLKIIYENSCDNLVDIMPELKKYLHDAFAMSFFKYLEQTI